MKIIRNTVSTTTEKTNTDQNDNPLQVASVGTKKEIIDYLREWGEQHDNWGKLLVQEILDKGRVLSTPERQKIYDTFLHSIGLKDDVKVEIIETPTIAFKANEVKLLSLDNIQGVNKLAKNQKLAFSDNVTVIYGENGTGKTGYGRILKLLGLCYEKSDRILGNIYRKDKTIQSASISYSVNGNEQAFAWNGKNHGDSDELRSISVFNNNCVKLSLNSERELLVTPIGFHLFTLLSNELTELSRIHKEYREKFTIVVPWMDRLNIETKLSHFLSSLTPKSSIADLKRLAKFGKEDAAALFKLEADLKKLNKPLLETEIKGLRLQKSELQEVISNLENVKSTLNKQEWKQYQADRKRLNELEQIEKKGLSELVKSRGIKFYESKEFQNFIKSADAYLKKLEKDNYPKNKDESCIYCQQKLTDPASLELLKNYRELLNDNTQADIKRIQKRLSAIQSALSGLDSKVTFKQPIFSLDLKGNPLQPKIIVNYNKQLKFLQTLVSQDNLESILEYQLNIDVDELISSFKQTLQTIRSKGNKKLESLTNIKSKEKELNAKINELKDAKFVNPKISEIQSIIMNLGIVDTLNYNASSFSTGSVSRKTTEARDKIVARDFNDIFKKELTSLRRSEIGVLLDFRTERGKSKLIQNIEMEYELDEILSEGEQKSIALAEFLTELQLNKTKAPVIFDDPVTSLDHNIIDEVARRLVHLSKDRQVIIFTHSILLFNSIKQKSELLPFKKLNFKYYETDKDLEFTGYLYESPDLKQDNFTKYEKRINEILNLPKETRAQKEGELAVEGYGKLRAAIEVFAEKDILCDSVKRYRKNVALTQLEKINGKLIDKHKEKLNTVFERCCGFTDAHSNPDPLPQKPDLEGLKLDFKEIQVIRTEFLREN